MAPDIDTMDFDYDSFYRDRGSEREPANTIVRKLIDYLPGPPAQKRILDLGAGDGRHAIYLAEKGFPVTAVDNSMKP